MAITELRKFLTIMHLMVLLWLRENFNFFIVIFSMFALLIIGFFGLWLMFAPYTVITGIVFLTRLYLEERSDALKLFLTVNNIPDIAWSIVKHATICLLTLPVVFLYRLCDERINTYHWMFTIIGCFLCLQLTFGLRNKFVIIFIGLFAFMCLYAFLPAVTTSGGVGWMISVATVLIVLNLIRLRNEYRRFF